MERDLPLSESLVVALVARDSIRAQLKVPPQIKAVRPEELHEPEQGHERARVEGRPAAEVPRGDGCLCYCTEDEVCREPSARLAEILELLRSEVAEGRKCE